MHISDKTVRPTLQLFPRHHVFFYRPEAQINASAGMASALQTELLPKTLGPFKVMTEPLDRVKVDENGIQNSVLIDMVMVPHTTH